MIEMNSAARLNFHGANPHFGNMGSSSSSSSTPTLSAIFCSQMVGINCARFAFDYAVVNFELTRSPFEIQVMVA